MATPPPKGPPLSAPSGLPTRVARVSPENEEVFSVYFETPGGFTYVAGQHVTLHRPGLEDPRGPRRTFTLSSSPTEATSLRITTRRGPSPFKQFLRSAGPGEPLELRGPLGTFTLDRARDALFVAGGIGITPFRSMARWAADTRFQGRMRLLYSVATQQGIPFRDELDAISRELPNFQVDYTLTRETPDDGAWKGRTGRVSVAWIREVMGQLERPKTYLCGPPSMVRGLREQLAAEADVPAADLRVESFSGY